MVNDIQVIFRMPTEEKKAYQARCKTDNTNVSANTLKLIREYMNKPLNVASVPSVHIDEAKPQPVETTPQA